MVVLKISETIYEIFLFIKLPTEKKWGLILCKHISEVLKLKV